MSKKINKDPAFMIMNDFITYRQKYLAAIHVLESKNDRLNRLYMAGLMEMQKEKNGSRKQNLLSKKRA